MHILIQGAGIAGLSLAYFLRKKGIRCTLVEQAPAFRNIGFAIVIWGCGRKILEKMDLHKKVDAAGHIISTYTVQNRKGETIGELNNHPFAAEHGHSHGMHRADLHAMLTEKVSDVPIKMGCSVTGIENNEECVCVRFSDRTSGEFDLLVGADGARSSVRTALWNQKEMQYYGFQSWIMWQPKELPIPSGIVEMIGYNKYVGLYPCINSCGVYIACKCPPHTADSVITRKQHLQSEFAEFGEPVQSILEGIEKPENMFHDDVTKMDLKSWHKNRVILIGDAAHKLSPITGLGASVALEDAYVLAEELSNVDQKHVQRALTRYEQRRRPRIATVTKLSRNMWRFNSLFSPVITALPVSLTKHIVPKRYFMNLIRAVYEHEV